MKIKFLGASGSVTGSSYLLSSSGGNNILIDLGLFQGSRELSKSNYLPLDFEAVSLDGVLVTHAHLDHCGRLPLLVKNGYKGPIYMTAPTADICEISLFDTAHINSEERDKPVLFDKKDVEKTIELFKTVSYDQSSHIGPFDCYFRDAGHILGSASIEIVDESSNNKKTIVFSGDLGNSPEELIKPTEKIASSNYVVVETTYGDRSHPPEDANDLLLNEINKIEETDSTLLIPAFSIERSQEILHRLSHFKASKRMLDTTQIFFDSPMAERVTSVFEKYHEYYNKELSDDFTQSDPFSFPGLTYIKNSRQSWDIHSIEGAKIIIAGSGMMTGGRILSHAAYYLPDEKNRILFVGYQGEGTLGREIIEGAKEVRIDKGMVEVKAHVSQIQSLSSHADQGKLVGWLSHIKNVERVFLTHGDEGAREEFSNLIKSELNLNNVDLPNVGAEFVLD